MPARAMLSPKRVRCFHSGEFTSHTLWRISSLVALAGMVLLAPLARMAYADPILISLRATGGGLSAIGATVTPAGEAEDGRQVFEIVINEQWESLAPGVLVFSNVPERAVLDVTKKAFNNTGTPWTSFATVTNADARNFPPFGFTFEAREDAFFSYEPRWEMTAGQRERCVQLFPGECGGPFRGNAVTFLNGTISPGETGLIRYILQSDGGHFTLTQSPGDAPVPEPSTFILVGTAMGAAWRARRRRPS